MKTKHRRTVSHKQSKPSTRRLRSATRLLSAARLFSAEDALQPPPPLLWCVDGLLAQPSLTMLVGDPGSKKTLLAIDLAVCVALGQPWLAHSVKQGPVLFIDEQSGPSQFWSRLNSALKGHAAVAETPLHYASLSGQGLRDKESAAALTKRAQALGASLIVFDAFANLLRGGGESSLGAVRPVLLNLRRMAESCRAAILVTHHTNRRGVFGGTTNIAASLDLLLSIESEPNELSIKITAKKSRFETPSAFTAKAHFETAEDGSHNVRLDVAKDAWSTSYWWQRSPYSTDSVEYGILQKLDYRGQVTFYELLINLVHHGQRNIRNAVQRLVDEGLIVRANDGKQGTEAIYKLVRPLDELWLEEKEKT